MAKTKPATYKVEIDLYEKLRYVAFNKRVTQSSILNKAIRAYFRGLELTGDLKP